MITLPVAAKTSRMKPKNMQAAGSDKNEAVRRLVSCKPMGGEIFREFDYCRDEINTVFLKSLNYHASPVNKSILFVAAAHKEFAETDEVSKPGKDRDQYDAGHKSHPNVPDADTRP